MASSSSAPWTANEIREKASAWTLEGDAKLLEFMQNISENIDRRATKTTANIHKLALDVDRTRVALGNVTNQLAALQHTQFVENRVYEDDETIANVSEVPVSDEVDNKTKYDPIETLTTLLNKSMAVVEKNYEKVSIDIDDSDEEDDSPKSIIYRPKDPYENQPLPYIIGSKEWTEKWHIGICDSDEDFSGEEKEEEFSDSSESASISASLPSNAPTMSESELSAWGLQQNSVDKHIKRRVGGYISSEEDVSVATKESFEDGRYRSNNRAQTLPYHSALPANDDSPANKYYVHQPKQKDGGLFDDSSDESTDSELYNVHGKSERTVPFPAIRKNNMISNIFSDEPPPDLDVVDQRSESRNDLFCESEEEIAGKQKQVPVVVKKEEPVANNIRKKTVNLFDDDDFDSFMKELNTKTQEKVATTEKQVRNLFEESSGEEEIIVPPVKEAILKKQVQENKIIIENLTEQIIIPPKIETETSKKDHIAQKPELSNAIKELAKPTPSVPQKKQSLFVNLFDDDPPDDDFDSLFNGKEIITRKESQNDVKSKTNIFDDFDEDEDIMNEKVPEVSKYSQMQTKVRPEEQTTTAASQEKPHTNYSKLFADESEDDEYDLFSNKKKEDAKNVSPVKAVGMPAATGIKKPTLGSVVVNANVESDGRIAKDSFNEISSATEKDNIKSLSNIFAINSTLEDLSDENETPSNEQKSKITHEKRKSDGTESSKHNLKLSNSNLFDDESGDESASLYSNKHSPSGLKESEEKLKEVIEKNDGHQLESEMEVKDLHDLKEVEVPFQNESVLQTSSKDLSIEGFESDAMNVIEKDEIISKLLNQKELGNSLFNDDAEPDVLESQIIDEFKSSHTLISSVESNHNVTEQSSNSEPLKLPADITNTDIQWSSHSENLSDSNNLEHDIASIPVESNSIRKTEKSQIFSTILFSDEPPNDDESFDVPSENIEKSNEQIPDVPTQTTNSQSSGLGYNAFGLFHDIPPDDDFDATPQNGKKLHNIFYDDFSETIIPSQIDTKPKSLSSFIFDEPPPDSFREEADSVSSKNDNKSKQESEASSEARFDSETKIASIIDRMQKNIDEPDKVIPVKNVTQPKKLNANFNINVAALLPGAKRPVAKVPEKEVKQEEEEKHERNDIKNSRESEVDLKPKIIHSDSDPSMLQSLNKNRAKIQIKRKPSTRRGRQENYRRSIIQEEDGKEGKDDGNNEEKLEVSSNRDCDTYNNFESNIVKDTSATAEHTYQVKNSIINENLNGNSSKPATTVLFDEEPPIDSEISTASFDKIAAGLFTEPPLDSVTSNTTDNTKNKSPALFLDDDNGKDELFTAKPTKPAVAVASIIKSENQKDTSSKSRTLLFEDESDNDDLFVNPQPSVLGSKSTATKVDNQPQVKNKVKQVETVKVSKSIFGSDDDDDDLFGSVAKSESATTTSKLAMIAANKTSQSRLFDDDDDDDDDDLFAGGDGKNKNTLPANSKRTEIRKPTQSVSKNKNFDDPLADLFKD